MTRRAPHPMLAALYRAGASASRTASALRRAQAKSDFASLSLEDHPLTAAPSWADLVDGPSADAHVAATLAHLAREETAPEPARGTRRLPETPDSASSEPAVREGASLSPPRRGGRLAKPGNDDRSVSEQGSSSAVPTRATGAYAPDTSDAEPQRRGFSRQPGSSGGHPNAQTPVARGPIARSTEQIASSVAAVERALRDYGPGQSEKWPSAGLAVAATKPALRSAPGLGPGTTTLSLMTVLSEQGREAAARRLGAEGLPLRQAAVERILRGEAAVPVAGTHTRTTETEQRMETALTRLGASPAPGPAPATGPRVVAQEPPVRRSAENPPREAASAPRNGIERLLQQAKRQNLIPEGQSQGDQARLSNDRPPQPDLFRSQRPEREAASPARLDANEVAQAVTELLRREARAAGIDLKGGRS